ncbi:substrate-binding domain-containing protein [Variovorax sp. AFSI2.2]|uniref:substrate-binding domain-containing protein n=1 Tax=Variovorax sp. AFSI2.2 TaxID=3384160 RepID=UPI003EBE5B0E
MNRRETIFSIAALAVVRSGSAFAAGEPKIGVVVKIGGIPYFNAMEVGIKERGKVLGYDAFMVAPTGTDPALQVKAIEDLIAQGVKAIGVVPNDLKALGPVLAKAKQAGIFVVTHESPNNPNADWDFELATVVGYGEAHAKLLAEKMDGKGQYAVYVGSLTVPLHNLWADAAVAYLAKNHPNIKLAGERYGVSEDADKSRATTLDLMAANPELKAVLCFGGQGPIGAGRAVEERRRVGKFIVVGSVSPRQGISLIKNDVIAGGFRWNPRTSGQVFVTLADRLIKGVPVKDGDVIEGLGVVRPDFKNHTITVDGLIKLDKTTVDEMAAQGL